MSRQKWGERIPNVARMATAAIAGSSTAKPISLPALPWPARRWQDRGQEPKLWDDVPPMIFSAPERLKAMDLDGVDCSVLYPSVSGLAAEIFGKLDDADLELVCVQAYNDWLIDEWASVSPRFVPQCIVPIWPMERTVAEIKRAVGKGHKGVIYPAVADGAACRCRISMNPLTIRFGQLAKTSGVPLCFHAGGSAKIQMRPGAALSLAVAAAFSGVVRSVSSVAVVANFLLSRVLDRFPN
jgi:predicted TIM-barrel fold metal-dependent hydrolase